MAVAVSGGVDSVCLLYWLRELDMDIVALHVNHKLRQAADVEEQYVIDLCKKLGIECHTFHWDGQKPETGLEDAARTARYKMMTDWCKENGIGVLLVAHQADDQIETFLMNLARGSGLTGLGAMYRVSTRDDIKIVRPLLGTYRHELQAYCDSKNIKYFKDEMNEDPHYTRVRIRQNRYVLDKKLGITDDRILLAIENLARARDAMDAIVEQNIAQVLKNGCALFSQTFLFDQAPDIRLKFLGTLIQRIGGDKYQPRLKSLENAVKNLQSDCKFTLGHCAIRRLGDRVMIVHEGMRTSFRKHRHEKYKKHIKK